MKRSGQMIVELLMVIGLSAITLPALLTGFVVSREGRPQQTQRLAAVAYLQETREALRMVRETGWVNVAANGTYHPTITGNAWTLDSGTETVNGLTRSIVLSDVFRDSSGAIVTSGGTIDPSTKRAVSTVSWTQPFSSSISATSYLTRYLDNAAYIRTTKAEFDTGAFTNTSTTNVSGGEVQMANNNKAKWCSPEFSSATIDLPDGPPVAVAATASASISNPNDVFVVTAPYATSSSKLAYLNVTANTDPPVSTLRGTFTLDASKYSAPELVPTGIDLDNSFKTNDVKYYKSAAGKLYALIATDLPTKEVVVVQINDGNGDAYQDPVNKIYKYWTHFNTAIYGPSSPSGSTPTPTPTLTLTPTPTSAIANTGYQNPSANSAASGGDNNGFQTNPTRAYTENSSYATDSNSGSGNGTSCTGSDKDKHNYYNYDLDIPAGSTINGIDVQLTGRVDSTSGSPKFCVQLSWDGGSSWTTAQSTSNLTTSNADYTLGGSADTWGRTWNSTTNFTNANFRLRVVSVASNTSRDFSLDWAGVRVYFSGYTPTNTPTPTMTPTPTPTPTGAPAGPNDQAPFSYGATSIAVMADKAYVSSGGYLYTFNLSDIDNKSPSDDLDQIGCRVQLDGYDCNPGSGTNRKYSAGQSGASWSDTATPTHNDCTDGGNTELYATNDIYPVQVGGNTYIYVAIGAGTNPEFAIVDVSSPPVNGSALTGSSCGRISGGASGWKVASTLDFNSQSNTEEAANSVYAKSDGTRAYISSNGGIDGNNNGQPDSKQFYVINTSNKSSPAFLSGTPATGATSGFYSGDSTQIQMFPRRSLTVLNGQRAVLVGKDGYPADGTNPQEYQVIDTSDESSPAYCSGLDFNSGFNDLTSVTEADYDNFVYMVANTNVNELKIIQGGPDGTYYDTGTYESAVFDAGYSGTFNRFNATSTVPANTSLRMQMALTDPVAGSCNAATYNFVGPDGTSGTYYNSTNGTIIVDNDGAGYENPAQCFKYKAYFDSTDFNATAVLNDITVNYSP